MAISLDEEVAEQMLDSKKPIPDPSMNMSEYSLEVEHLQLIHSALHNVFAAVVASMKQKPPRYRPLPTPRTALQVKKSERRVTNHRALVARVIPKKT